MEKNGMHECPSCGNQMGGNVNRCALCGYVLDLHMPVAVEQDPDITPHDFLPDEEPPDANSKSSQPMVWISIILIVIGAFFLIKDLIATKMEDSVQLIIQAPTPSKKILNNPTVSIIEDKENALKAAEKFSILMEEGDEGMKELITPGSQHYDAVIESINTIIHDTLKYGEYIKIYDLSISDYSNQKITISGYLENRPFSGWLKYYLDIYLSKYGNSWLITSWKLVKT